MDTPPGIFGQSKKSNFKSFSTSKKRVTFDESAAALQLELQAERRQKEDEEERIKQEQYDMDEMYRQLNKIPFVGMITSPPPCDPHQYSAEHKRKSSFLSSSPSLKPSKFDQSTSSFSASNFGSHAAEREKVNSYLSSSPPFNNSKGYRPHSKFANSRYGSIGDGRPTLNSPSSFSNSNNSAKHFNMSYFKTALCRQYTQSKTCTYGDECRYAHGVDELRLPATAHPNYKRVLCKHFIETGVCVHGSRCKYIHRHPDSFQVSCSGFASSTTQNASFNH